MSRSAFSLKVFATYLFVLGTFLIVAPNVLLVLFGMAPTSEVWIRVIGLLVVNIGVFSWVAARHENQQVMAASVITRCFVFVTLGAFVGLGLASPMLILFGAIDLLAALWTHFARKADAR